jgi:hypothetical protein
MLAASRWSPTWTRDRRTCTTGRHRHTARDLGESVDAIAGARNSLGVSAVLEL